MSFYHTLCFLLILLSLCHGKNTISILSRHPDLNGLLPNGNFEQTPLESNMKGRQIIRANALPHWQIFGYVELVSGGLQPGGFNYSIPRGAHAVKLGGLAIISQEVKVKRGVVYSLTVGVTRSCAGDKKIIVSVSGRSGKIPIETIFSSDAGDSYAWAFTAMSDVVRVTLQNLDLHLHLDRAKPNRVQNGRFDIGPYVFAKYSTGVLIPAKGQEDFISPLSPLPNWFVESPKPVKYITNSNFELRIQTRLPAVELIAGKESAISQLIPTHAGHAYFLSFMAGDAHNECHGSMMVKAFAGKQSFNVSFVSKGKGSFKARAFRFVAVSERTKLTFYSVFNHTRLHDSGDLCGPVLDNVVVIPAYF
ncbi:hypothetical protein HID58_058149 [Brassica napus]|uniref:DUF642 domain-containing protein n=1 Tax=Brassica napus TaxID=3708 RepID=A0ABQ7ZPW8_BRANA|nr:hypothetical protein HID58_058149 [Brassica napus]